MMIDRTKVIKGLECCTTAGFGCIENKECPYSAQRYGSHCVDSMLRDAIALLKAQEPRLVTEADFENADPYGYLPVWVEDKDDTEIVCNCITKAALTDVDAVYTYRFWTSRPDEKRSGATPWN